MPRHLCAPEKACSGWETQVKNANLLLQCWKEGDISQAPCLTKRTWRIVTAGAPNWVLSTTDVKEDAIYDFEALTQQFEQQGIHNPTDQARWVEARVSMWTCLRYLHFNPSPTLGGTAHELKAEGKQATYWRALEHPEPLLKEDSLHGIFQIQEHIFTSAGFLGRAAAFIGRSVKGSENPDHHYRIVLRAYPDFLCVASSPNKEDMFNVFRWLREHVGCMTGCSQAEFNARGKDIPLLYQGMISSIKMHLAGIPTLVARMRDEDLQEVVQLFRRKQLSQEHPLFYHMPYVYGELASRDMAVFELRMTKLTQQPVSLVVKMSDGTHLGNVDAVRSWSKALLKHVICVEFSIDEKDSELNMGGHTNLENVPNNFVVVVTNRNENKTTTIDDQVQGPSHHEGKSEPKRLDVLESGTIPEVSTRPASVPAFVATSESFHTPAAPPPPPPPAPPKVQALGPIFQRESKVPIRKLPGTVLATAFSSGENKTLWERRKGDFRPLGFSDSDWEFCLGQKSKTDSSMTSSGKLFLPSTLAAVSLLGIQREQNVSIVLSGCTQKGLTSTKDLIDSVCSLDIDKSDFEIFLEVAHLLLKITPTDEEVDVLAQAPPSEVKAEKFMRMIIEKGLARWKEGIHTLVAIQVAEAHLDSLPKILSDLEDSVAFLASDTFFDLTSPVVRFILETQGSAHMSVDIVGALRATRERFCTDTSGNLSLLQFLSQHKVFPTISGLSELADKLMRASVALSSGALNGLNQCRDHCRMSRKDHPQIKAVMNRLESLSARVTDFNKSANAVLCQLDPRPNDQRAKLDDVFFEVASVMRELSSGSSKR